MSRSIFGWSLPPGCTHRMIEEQCEEGPCAVCAMDPADCICLECPECGAQGDPKCYEPRHSEKHWDGPNGHGLKLNKAQCLSRQRAVIYAAKQRVQDEEMALHCMEESSEEHCEYYIHELPDPWR